MVGADKKRVNVIVYKDLYDAYKKKAIKNGTDERFLYRKLDEIMRKIWIPIDFNLMAKLNGKIVRLYNYPLPIKTTITLTQYGFEKRKDVIRSGIDYSVYINILLYLYVNNKVIKRS